MQIAKTLYQSFLFGMAIFSLFIFMGNSHAKENSDSWEYLSRVLEDGTIIEELLPFLEDVLIGYGVCSEKGNPDGVKEGYQRKAGTGTHTEYKRYGQDGYPQPKHKKKFKGEVHKAEKKPTKYRSGKGGKPMHETYKDLGIEPTSDKGTDGFLQPYAHRDFKSQREMEEMMDMLAGMDFTSFNCLSREDRLNLIEIYFIVQEMSLNSNS